MIKLSTRGRYGARLMLDLALNSGRGPVLLRDLAERQEISEKYLWQLMSPLKAAGLVQATRGAHGGYTLARDPALITLAHIVSALEGPVLPMDCLADPGSCSRALQCVTRDVWRELGETITDTLDSITLRDLVERHREKAAAGTSAGSYSI